jgi:hypothetical protein
MRQIKLLVCFDSEDGCGIYVRNIGNIAQIHTILFKRLVVHFGTFGLKSSYVHHVNNNDLGGGHNIHTVGLEIYLISFQMLLRATTQKTTPQTFCQA